MSPRARRGLAAASNSTPFTNALIMIVVLVATAVLCYFDKVSGDAFIGLAGGIVGAVGAQRAFSAGSKASTDPPPSG